MSHSNKAWIGDVGKVLVGSMIGTCSPPAARGGRTTYPERPRSPAAPANHGSPYGTLAEYKAACGAGGRERGGFSFKPPL